MKLIKPILLATSLSAISACTSGILGEASYVDGRHEMNSQTQNFVVGMRIAMDDIKTTRVNDLMVANVQLRNKWPFTQDITYRANWFDKDNIEIEPERAVWNKLILTGKTERTVKLTAPTPEAVHVEITVRD